MVAFDLHAAGEGQQRHDGRDKDGGRLAATPGSHVAADRLGEEEGRGGVGRVDADREAGHVHALGQTAHVGHHPALPVIIRLVRQPLQDFVAFL